MSNQLVPLVVVKDGADQEIELARYTPKARLIPSETIKEILPTDFGGSSLRVVERGGIKKEVLTLESPLQVEAARDPSSTNLHVQTQVDAGVTAAGSTQGAGYSVNKYLTEVDTATDSSAEALTLPAKATGLVFGIINNTNVDLEIFPASGEEIDELGTDTQYDLPANSTVYFACVDADNAGWVATALS